MTCKVNGNRSAAWLAWLAGAVMTLLAGCGGGTGELRGVVTYQGKPLECGTVTVVGRDKLPYVGSIDETGHYSVAGVPTGEVKIGVTVPDPPADTPPAAAGGHRGLKRPNAQPSAAPSAKKWVKIPESYGDPEGSGLTATVGRGSTPHDIELK